MIRRQQGFTAIELVTALTILMGITAMLGIILARSNRIWSDTTEAARTRQAGRRALELLTRDLEASITDEQFPFIVDESDTEVTYAYRSDRLRFITLGTIGYDGTAQQRLASAVGYWVEHPADTRYGGFELLRGTLHQTNIIDRTDDNNLYWRTNLFEELDFPAYEPVARHVTAFRVFAPSPEHLTELAATYDSLDYANRPPPFADIFLELLVPSDARQLTRLPEDDKPAFIDQRAIRYTTRVALGNSWGRSYRGR